MSGNKTKTHRAIVDTVLFAMLGALMFALKVVFEPLPNIHPVTMLIMVYTIVFGWKALFPTYVFVVLLGAFYGFGIWWIPYLYVWAVYVALTLLLPKNMPRKIAAFVYPAVCALFGLMYGILYAPGQALLFGYTFRQMLAWIAAGFPYDALHALGNLAMGLLVLPLSVLSGKLYSKMIGS